MKLKTLSLIPLLLMLLTACGTLGVPVPQTFNQKAAAATASVNAASQLDLTLLQARKITPDESDRYINRIEDVQHGIIVARGLRSTDPALAQDRLDLIIKALAALTAELESRK